MVGLSRRRTTSRLSLKLTSPPLRLPTADQVSPPMRARSSLAWIPPAVGLPSCAWRSSPSWAATARHVGDGGGVAAQVGGVVEEGIQQNAHPGPAAGSGDQGFETRIGIGERVAGSSGPSGAARRAASAATRRPGRHGRSGLRVPASGRSAFSGALTTAKWVTPWKLRGSTNGESATSYSGGGAGV